ncbi:MAG: hypothetical protein IJK81_07095 [Selenomonadaceae bacterium]|nr:hypothetical protein [Selenomonadaceae bacterium]
MNLWAWSNKKCVAVPEEFLRAGKAEILAYINANPNKIYLLPDVQEFFDAEISARIAQEIKFPCAAKLISSTGEFEVETLSAVLEAISYDENFMATGKNFLVVPQSFINMSDAIKRQCSFLQVPLEICSAEEFSAIAVEQKLMDNAENFLRELDGVKNLQDKTAELKLQENISYIEEFLSATEELKKYLKSFNTLIKLILTGEHEHLTEIFKRLNFETEILSDAEVSKNLPNCNVCVFAVNALNNDFARTEKFLETIAAAQDKNKIIFVLINPALRESDMAINSAKIFFDFAKILDARGFNDAPIFFLDAPEVFLTISASGDEWLTVAEITNSLGLTGREEFFTTNFLEKFFEALPNPSSKSLLQKTGVPYLEKYLRQSLKKNPSITGELLRQVERAVAFIDDDTLKNMRLIQTKKLSADARQIEILREKILVIAMQEKTVSGNSVAKALLYDVNNAINNFIQAIKSDVDNIFDELIASEEFSAEKMVALHQGKISTELKNFVATVENQLQSEYDEQSKQLITLTKKIIDEHKTQAKEFIDCVSSVAENSSSLDTTLPEIKINVPPFNVGISESFSRDNLSELVKRCTRIICTQEVAEDWTFFKANRKQLLENFYLAGTFRRELRNHLEEIFNDKMNALEKNLRQKFFAATIEYFTQVSTICRNQRELCTNIFRQHAENIYNKIDFLNQDFVVMEEISSALKNFYNNWRLICPKQSSKIFSDENSSDNLLDDMLERKSRLLNFNVDISNDLSAEKFLPPKIGKPRKHSTANDDFSLGKAAFNKKKYKNALESFSRAAATGHVESIKYLAYMYQNGLGMPKNIHAAIESCLDASGLGDNDSVSELGGIFWNLKCYSRALEWWQTAAERGDKRSVEVLGITGKFK